MKKEIINKKSINYKKIKIIFKRIIEILKIILFISMIIGINVISNKITSAIIQLTFTQIKVAIFSIISTIILYVYLKSCEEIKIMEE